MSAIGTWVKETRKLALQAGAIDTLDPVLGAVDRLQQTGVTLAVVGGANSGKSSFINALLGEKVIPITTLPAQHAYRIGGVSTTSANVFDDGDEQTRVLTVEHEWLDRYKLTIVERLPLDGEQESDAVDSLEGADLVVHLVDATMPMRRIDVLFLTECVRRGVPTLVVVSKVDRLDDADRRDVLNYVRKHWGSIDPEGPTIELCVTPTRKEGLLACKTYLEKVLAETDIVANRRRQLMGVLLDCLRTLRAAAEAGREAQRQDEQQRQETVRRQKLELEGQNVKWQQLEEQFRQRRQQADPLIREHLSKHREQITEVLLYELERTNDVKTWWEKDFPFRLQRELRNVASQCSTALNHQVAADIRWLQAALKKELNYTLQVLPEHKLQLPTAEAPSADLDLVGGNTMRILARLGTAATVLGAGALFASVSVGGLVLATSVVAGLGAEQLVRLKTSRDRSVVREELDRVIVRAELECATSISRTLEEGYASVLADVRKHQLRWQQTQLKVLSAMHSSPPESAPDWDALVASTEKYIAEIQEQLSPAQ